MTKSFLVIVLLAAMQACSYSVTNYIRNDASNEVVVSIQRGKTNLEWERKESDSFAVKPNTICRFGTDPFSDIYLYIKNIQSGKSTNINLMRNGSFTYAVENDGQEQVVTIKKADRKTKKLLEKEHGVSCRPWSAVENETYSQAHH